MFHYYGKPRGLSTPTPTPTHPRDDSEFQRDKGLDETRSEATKRHMSDEVERLRRELSIAHEHNENNQNIILKMSEDWTRSNDELSRTHSETKEAYQSLTKQQTEEISKLLEEINSNKKHMEEFKKDTLKIVNDVEERLMVKSDVFESEVIDSTATKNETGAKPHPKRDMPTPDVGTTSRTHQGPDPLGKRDMPMPAVFERLYKNSKKSFKKERK